MIRDSPDASLREIAQAAGVSLGTAHDIRARLDRGEDPLGGPKRRRPSRPPSWPRCAGSPPSRHAPASQARAVRRPGEPAARPSLRFTDHGRALLVWLHRRLVVVGEAESELDNIPPHLLPVVAELAQECSDIWHNLSLELQYRARQIG